MFEGVRVVPLAGESLGVRSMCVCVETPNTVVVLDAGVSLAPKRLGFLPHPREYQALVECRERIREQAQRADVVTVSHYHFDHHTPSYTDWFTCWSSAEAARNVYEGKVVLAKSFRSKVNASQRRRGWMFKKTGGSYAKRFEIADGKVFQFGDTVLKFSEAVFHGPEDSELGWVIMTSIQFADEKFVFAPDVQGPMCTPTLDWILAEAPQLVVVGGPPTYLKGFRVKEEHVAKGIENLCRLVESVPTSILGHHLLRDENWRNFTQPVFDAAAKAGNKVVTAAEYLGKENNFLEFRRRQLFETEPPDSDFRTWMKLPLHKRKVTKPPI